MNLVLDAGALISIDRDDRRTAGLIELGWRSGAGLVTTAPVVGQVGLDPLGRPGWLVCWR